MSRKLKNKKNYRMYNETLYEVERVVQIRWVKNRQYCLIKWRGYDDKYNTWEPKDHITFCYNYEAPEERDDDPEYQEKLPNCNPTPHHYQTRAKKKPTPDISTKAPEIEEKEDHTELEEHSGGPTSSYNLFPIDKPIKEINRQILDIRKKGDLSQTSISTSKDELISRLLQFSSEKNSEVRRGKVETMDGKIIYVNQDVLKARYPEKVIEYYEQKYKARYD